MTTWLSNCWDSICLSPDILLIVLAIFAVVVLFVVCDGDDDYGW